MTYTCRACGSSNLRRHVIGLGSQAPSNALLTYFHEFSMMYPLCVNVCTDCWLMQTAVDVPHAELFNADYPYFSGATEAWRDRCKEYADYLSTRFNLYSGSSVLEIGGNDGTLLQHFAQCSTSNVEPSASVARAAMDKGIPTFVGRFQDVTTSREDLIIANNVLAHDPDLCGFVDSIQRNLAPTGAAVIEFPWVVRLLEDCQFDTIYHEHYSYLSLTALIPLFRRFNLHIYDVDVLEEIHGGSLRIYVSHLGVARSSNDNVAVVLAQESDLRKLRTYEIFRERAFNTAGAIHRFLRGTGPIHAACAAAKATVFTNFCALTHADILMVSDNSKAKQGKFLPGSRIPIVTEEALLANNPRYILIFAWNWKYEVAAKFRRMGYKGKFVTAIPELEVFE